MDALKKQHLTAIQKLLQQGKTSAKSTAVWTHICETQGVGELCGKQYVFTARDLAQLRTVLGSSPSQDLLHANLEGSRIETARIAVNEKVAGNNVFDGYIQAFRANAKPLSLKSGVAVAPEGVPLCVHIDNIEIDTCPLVVIVENGEVFLSWHKLDLPKAFDGALVVYRGHGADQSYVNQLVSLLAGHSMPVVGFFDYDPAGILMAMSMGVGKVLVPLMWAEHSSALAGTSLDFNSFEKFAGQVDAALSVLRKAPEGSCKLLRTVVNGQWGYQQEHMVAHEMPLCCVELG